MGDAVDDVLDATSERRLDVEGGAFLARIDRHFRWLVGVWIGGTGNWLPSSWSRCCRRRLAGSMAVLMTLLLLHALRLA